MLLWDMGFPDGLRDLARLLDITAKLGQHGMCMPHGWIWGQQWMNLNHLSSCCSENTATSLRELWIFVKCQLLLLGASSLDCITPLLSSTSRSITVGKSSFVLIPLYALSALLHNDCEEEILSVKQPFFTDKLIDMDKDTNSKVAEPGSELGSLNPKNVHQIVWP